MGSCRCTGLSHATKCLPGGGVTKTHAISYRTGASPAARFNMDLSDRSGVARYLKAVRSSAKRRISSIRSPDRSTPLFPLRAMRSK